MMTVALEQSLPPSTSYLYDGHHSYGLKKSSSAGGFKAPANLKHFRLTPD